MAKTYVATQIGKAGEASLNIFKSSQGALKVEANYTVKDADGNVLFLRSAEITALLPAALSTTVSKAYDDLLARVETAELS